MFEAQFDAALDLIHTGTGREPIQRLVEIALNIANTPIAYIVARCPEGDFVLASHGIPHVPMLVPLPPIARSAFAFDESRIIPDLAVEPGFADHPLTLEHGWRWLAVAPVPLPMLARKVAVVCADTRINQPKGHQVLERLRHLAAVASDELQMLGVIGETLARHPYPRSQPAIATVEKSLPGTYEPVGVVADFLLDTLVMCHRVLTRGSTSYNAIATWRQSIKTSQLAALRALKRNPPPAFVERAATMIATATTQMFDHVAASVVPVACGNSGEQCLAAQLAERVAQLLDRPFIPAFALLDVAGGSHPRKNAARPRMRIEREPEGPVLLIDDVAASGSHITEAARLLRSRGLGVFSIVWIAS